MAACSGLTTGHHVGQSRDYEACVRAESLLGGRLYVWGLSSIVWTDPDSRQRNLLLDQKIDFDTAVAGNARPAVGASLTPRAIGRVVGLQYWGVYNPVPLLAPLPLWMRKILLVRVLVCGRAAVRRKKIRNNNISQQSTLEGISRDREHGLTCCKDQYFQEKLDPCVHEKLDCTLFLISTLHVFYYMCLQ
jgi:hypothetical protein